MLKNRFGHSSTCRLHSATENGQRQQELISKMSVAHKPTHRFSDILDRLPANLRAKCDAFVDETFASLK
eukprot:9737850-Alexandrium_andersonii.AAC.1